MYRGAARPALRRQSNRKRTGRHHPMSAPLKNPEPVIVDVALGERTYDIVIGRGVLASLGARVAALRPGARAAIVTDEYVATRWLRKAEASLLDAGIATSRIIVDEGEGWGRTTGGRGDSEERVA